MLQTLIGLLKTLKRIADEQAGKFESEGFLRFFAMMRRELDNDYFAAVEQHLKTLQFRHGVLLSAALGRGNEGVSYVLCKRDRLKVAIYAG